VIFIFELYGIFGKYEQDFIRLSVAWTTALLFIDCLCLIDLRMVIGNIEI